MILSLGARGPSSVLGMPSLFIRNSLICTSFQYLILFYLSDKNGLIRKRHRNNISIFELDNFNKEWHKIKHL